MRNLLIIVSALFCLMTAYATPELQKIVDELNIARTEPAKYAKFIEQHKLRFIDDMIYEMPGRGRIRTQEGIAAVDEAIAFLKKQKPIGKLTLNEGLSRASEDHTRDIGPAGVTGHDGTDGSTSTERVNRHGKWQKACGENISFGPRDPREIVMQLIIDDGVANRGHRDNIYNKDFKVVGVAVGAHKKYGYMCTMNYAGGFVSKSKPKAK